MDTQRDTVMEESLCALVAMTADMAMACMDIGEAQPIRTVVGRVTRAVVRELGKNGMLAGGRDALPELWVGLTAQERTADW